MRRASGHSAVPLALDEDATEDLALDTPAAAAVVCLKLQAWGGIGNLIEAAEAARRAGMLVTLGSTLEGPVGIAASLTAAQIIGPELDSGLGTLEVFEEDFPVLTAADGRLSAPGGIGLGVDADGVRC